jgi:hypothetical protein
MKGVFPIMDNIFELDILGESTECDIYSVFTEYDALMDRELYFDEVVRDASRSIDNTVNKIVRNTIDTTRDVGDAYDKVTDAGGNILKAGWDLAMKLIHLALKAISFVSGIISKIPDVINSLGRKIKNLGSRTINRINGNISLYITMDDIKYINEHYIFQTMNEIISSGVAVSNDDIWDTLAKRKNDGKRKNASKSMIKYCTQIIKGRLKIDGMRFAVSTVDLSNTAMKNMYFGTTDDGGNTYLSEMRKLIDAVNGNKAEMKRLGELFQTKYEHAIASGAFANYNLKEQKLIQRAISDLAKTAVDVSRIVQHANKDITTINKAVSKIIDEQSKGGN